jgi:hypothetical protein
MPFLSCKYFSLSFPNPHLTTEKQGKTLHLLKASSKKINPHKKRKIIPLLGSIKDFHKNAPKTPKPQISTREPNLF